jgi:hypothetical protein
MIVDPAWSPCHVHAIMWLAKHPLHGLPKGTCQQPENGYTSTADLSQSRHCWHVDSPDCRTWISRPQAPPASGHSFASLSLLTGTIELTVDAARTLLALKVSEWCWRPQAVHHSRLTLCGRRLRRICWLPSVVGTSVPAEETVPSRCSGCRMQPGHQYSVSENIHMPSSTTYL